MRIYKGVDEQSKKKILIEFDTAEEAEQVAAALEQPDVLALVRVVGTLMPLSPRQRKRVMEQVLKKLET